MENNRAINPCICTLSIVTIGKVLMRSEIGLKFIVSFVVWLIKMAEMISPGCCKMQNLRKFYRRNAMWTVLMWTKKKYR